MSAESPLPKPAAGEWLDDLIAGVLAYYLTSLPVLLGVWFSVSFLSRDGTTDPIAACVHFNAIQYIDIIRHGHTYDPERQSTVAQFPAYPLIARWVCQATGLAPEEGALLTSNFFLAGAFVFLARWVRLRWPEATADQRMLVLAIFGLWPMGLFWRMPYAESLLLFGTLAVLYGMARGWPLWLLAALTGFVTATRPVGLALTAAFLWHVPECASSRPRSTAARLLLLAPLACWGLLAYMLFQGLAFGTPWAFAQTQEHWTLGSPPDDSWTVKAVALLTLEPIRGVYEPSSPRYWENLQVPGGPIFSELFWNPILFILATAFLVLGRWKRWLTISECILGASLLLIPYLTRAFEMSMASHGRFAAVVAVNYLVIARLLAARGPITWIAFSAGCAIILLLFSSLYAASYLMF